MRSSLSLVSNQRERFIDDLVGYMTLEEKLGQLNLAHDPRDPGLEAAITAGRIGGVAGCDAAQRLQTLALERSRLGIPLLVCAPPPAAPLSAWALAASWDEALAYQLGGATVAALLPTGANTLLGPNVAIEDEPDVASTAMIASTQAHLAGRMAAAFASGVGSGASAVARHMLAIPKVDGTSVQRLQCSLELALGGQVAALDCDVFNRDLALKAGFEDLLVADCQRLRAILADHFATTSARSPIEAAGKALVEGRVAEHEIDRAVRGVLAVKHAMGLFGDRDRNLAAGITTGEVPPQAEMARRCMVLLRNESGLLPLSPVSDRVLVVGPAQGVGGACADALSRAGIGYSIAPGLALRRADEAWTVPVSGDHFALSLTRDAAERADFVIVALDKRHFTAPARGSWGRPGQAMMNLLRGLSTTGTRLVALIVADQPVDLADADQHFSAVLHCWGASIGFEEALADILSGRDSPRGRMPVTAGRFEFGQGLSYGESVFSALTVEGAHDRLLVSIRVRNAGSFPGRETVQVYVRDESERLRLVGFDNVTLAPGEDAPVRFELGLAALGQIGASGRLEVTPGPREILVGKSSARVLTLRYDIAPALARAMRNGASLRLAAG